MPHAPLTRPHTPRVHPPHRRRAPDGLVAALRDAIADAHHLDPADLRARPAAPVAASTLDLLGDEPVRTGAEAAVRLDALARALVERMRAAGWDEGAAPRAVTSVLAASVPAAEAALLREARSRRW